MGRNGPPPSRITGQQPVSPPPPPRRGPTESRVSASGKDDKDGGSAFGSFLLGWFMGAW